ANPQQVGDITLVMLACATCNTKNDSKVPKLTKLNVMLHVVYWSFTIAPPH
ncbi:5205_t:CDS:2, partial [Funneliformis mosseae]